MLPEMTKKRMVTQFGMGTSIRKGDYTRAAERAIRDALWHNSLNVADAFGFPKDAMLIEVELGAQNPGAIDTAALADIFPYGQPTISVTKGGLDIAKPDGQGGSIIVNAAVVVYFDMVTTA